ncbi:MAG TPA: CHAT domain-containing protein [Streptosporangiaceae bacterium]
MFEEGRVNRGGYMLARDNLESLLEMVTSAENVDVRLTGLDAITHFPLSADAWRAVGPALRGVLVDATQGSSERNAAIELAARAPLTSVRSELAAIGQARGDPDAVKVRRVLHRPSSSDIEELLQRLENDPLGLDSGPAEDLATLPIESVSHDNSWQRGLKRRLRALTKSPTPDVVFWVSLALARLGDKRALDHVLSGQGQTPQIFWGSPWEAYDRLARLRPIPGALHAHLMRWVERHPDQDRDAALVAWALTGSADAEGTPIPAVPVEAPEESAQRPVGPVEPEEGPQAVGGAHSLEHAADERGEETTTEDAVEGVLANLFSDAWVRYPDAALRSLTTEQAVTVLVRAVRRIAEKVAGWGAEEWEEASWEGMELGNLLVEIAAMVPKSTDLPVREIYRIHTDTLRPAIDDRQTAFVLSRSTAPHLFEQFSQDLPNMEPREQIDALKMLASAGDFQRGAPWPMLGAGPGDTAPAIEPATLIDDVTSPPGEPPAGERENLASTTTAWPYLDAPPAVVVGRPFEVSVGLDEQQDLALYGTGELQVPAADFTLGVEMLIDGFAIVGDRVFTLEVNTKNRYPKRTVTLIAIADADLAERRRIGIIFRVGREMRGYAGRDIVVKTTEAELASVPAAATGGGPGEFDTSPFTAPDAPDLTIVIQYGDAGDGSRLVWSAASPHINIPLPVKAVGPPIGSSAERFQEELVAEASSTTDALDVFTSLCGRGKADIAPRIPKFVKDALRSVAQAVAPRPPTVLLLSQDPYVPWELAVLDPPLPGWPADGSPFLGAQTVIGRWVLASEPPPKVDPPKRVTVRDEAVVTGVYDGVPDWRRLESAEHEAAELRDRWPAASAVDASLPAVLACLKGTPAADIIHFALHGEFSTETARQGLVLIGSVPGHADQRRPVFLKPSHVDDGELRRSPLVFLNACQVGAGRLVLGNYSGMASAFVRVGASAVVAPLWSVDDEVASALALDFYARVLEVGEAPAEVLRANRAGVTESAINSDDRESSGTHLAYQLFGHPNLHLVEARDKEEEP